MSDCFTKCFLKVENDICVHFIPFELLENKSICTLLDQSEQCRINFHVLQKTSGRICLLLERVSVDKYCWSSCKHQKSEPPLFNGRHNIYKSKNKFKARNPVFYKIDCSHWTRFGYAHRYRKWLLRRKSIAEIFGSTLIETPFDDLAKLGISLLFRCLLKHCSFFAGFYQLFPSIKTRINEKTWSGDLFWHQKHIFSAIQVLSRSLSSMTAFVNPY